MTEFYSEAQLIATVSRLTLQRLLTFVEAKIIAPIQSERGNMYRQIDLVRIELLCDLSDQFDLRDDGLAVTMSLIDQLHGVRAELRAVLDAVAAEAPEVRARVCDALELARSAPPIPDGN